MTPQEIQNQSFEYKNIWFRNQCEQLRIPWTYGSDWIFISSNNVLFDSVVNIQYCDLRREIKIQFSNDIVQDAGGLLREWVHLCTRDIFDKKIEMFVKTDTQNLAYRINSNIEYIEYFIELFGLLGKIVGKSLFERIPIKACFDRTIINYILGKNNLISDIYYYDEKLYNSYIYLVNNTLKPDDYIGNFTIEKQINGKIQKFELIENGENIEINNENKLFFIEKQIQYLCVEFIKPFLESMCQEIYKVIPFEILSIFQSHELEMILNGITFINLDDWKNNTEYKGNYSSEHQVVKWFWQILSELNQQQLSRFLQFCTGCSQTPIEGFKKLESNRGDYQKFVIQQVEYDIKYPYPKSHTCFNRLELPMYQSLEDMRNNIQLILQSDFEGLFGME
ncbi:hypothetical protein IMG5_121350 [Ichthyophthirius multifiliis]|uniref:HECT-type E3 ubiquitin transferase n=1 Tax=Ichthyophthirius multifiliis TaxID=5932 RepID=G0QV48_ICHMU|nr:hypothetical protein IMG5_121350 [Ichthyophthirius multifiliis]EGR30889.1 hypothetical protein IMG5_121350 [Ichthyophthirius multifiliis]|eukprot:XP_004032476.1 hypothetical protein IMG5_121350 [Ichthyophthirius multifiliis]